MHCWVLLPVSHAKLEIYWEFCFCVLRSVRESLKFNIFREAHHRSMMISLPATSQTGSRNIWTKDTVVPSWILERHFVHFPANDSISTSLASHSAHLSFPSMSPYPPEMGCFGNARSYHEICLCVWCVRRLAVRKYTVDAQANYTEDQDKWA